MTNCIDSLLCYKSLNLNDATRLTFFLNKHSTKEGTWGRLVIESGELDFIYLDGANNELKRHRLNTTHTELIIPPACWHKIEIISESFAADLSFYCKPHRYFNKKYGLGNVHNDLLYLFNHYISTNESLKMLDVGCGKGRNLLYAALLGHRVSGVDINEQSLSAISDIVDKENLGEVNLCCHDLHQGLAYDDQSFDLIISTVSLQFINPERIPSLVDELQQLTVTGGMNFIVHPIAANPFQLPSSFVYTPGEKTLYHYYQDRGWAILEYTESVGQLHRLDDSGKPIQGKFALLLAQKC